ncbi:MAG TPA: efflux RND transporter periplasmic adaptor subunit [Longimicrobiales bacterium]|nr:efflux RND transporter periplasmic adaptor subunit [Longimicrobiales bacterium]
MRFGYTHVLRAAVVVALAITTACSAEADGSAGGARAQGGGPGKGGPGGPGGRAGSVTLSASDVMAVQRGPLSEGVAVTGSLLPLERADIRARLEGDLVGVYVREGQPVRAGEVLARFDPSDQVGEARSGEADLASARTDLATAEWNRDQTRELFKQGAVPERDLKSAEQAVVAAEARVAAAQARVQSASRLARDTRVVAPFTGVIEKREADAGEHVTRSQSLFTIVRNEMLELAAQLPARKADGIVPGQPVVFNAGGTPFEGKVARVSPTIDPVTRSITVYVHVPNPGGVLKGGTFATGRVVRRTLPNALAIPTAAVRQAPNTGHPFVYKIDGGAIAEAPLVLGAVDEAREMVEVRDGLKEGDRVVVGNVGLLGDGMRVQILGTDERGAAAAPAAGRRRRPGD